MASRKKDLYGERLDQLMSDRSIRPDTMAKDLNITINEVLNLACKDRSKVDPALLTQVAEYLGVQEEYLSSPHLKSSLKPGYKSIGEINASGKQHNRHYGDEAARSRLEQTKIVRALEFE